MMVLFYTPNFSQKYHAIYFLISSFSILFLLRTWLMVTHLPMVGDHPFEGGGPSIERLLTFGWWMTILGWITILVMAVDRPGYCRWPSQGWWWSMEWWVTILGKVAHHPWNGGWPFWGLWINIRGLVFDRPWDIGWLPWYGRWPPKTVVTWS